jgi:hypothetical protein
MVHYYNLKIIAAKSQEALGSFVIMLASLYLIVLDICVCVSMYALIYMAVPFLEKTTQIQEFLHRLNVENEVYVPEWKFSYG